MASSVLCFTSIRQLFEFCMKLHNPFLKRLFGFREAARAIVNDENWMQAMRNKTWEQRRVTTPMRKLIIKLPGMCKPLNPRSNQHQISPFNINAL